MLSSSKARSTLPKSTPSASLIRILVKLMTSSTSIMKYTLSRWNSTFSCIRSPQKRSRSSCRIILLNSTKLRPLLTRCRPKKCWLHPRRSPISQLFIPWRLWETTILLKTWVWEPFIIKEVSSTSLKWTRLVRSLWKPWTRRMGNCLRVWECWLKCQQLPILMTRRTFRREPLSTPLWPQIPESSTRSGNRVPKTCSRFSKSPRFKLLMASTRRNHLDRSRPLLCLWPWKEKTSKRSSLTRSTSRISTTIVNQIRLSQLSIGSRTTSFLRNLKTGWCHRLLGRLRVVNHQSAVILESLLPRWCLARFFRKALCRKIWAKRIDQYDIEKVTVNFVKMYKIHKKWD